MPPDPTPILTVDFAGTLVPLDGTAPFAIGREGDLALDDNPYLHRRFLEIRHQHGLWWLINVGAQLTASVSNTSIGVHAWLAPGGRMPIVFTSTEVRFTAGPTAYEVCLDLAEAPYPSDSPDEPATEGSTTVGRVTLTLDQRLLLVILAESALRRGAPGLSDIPNSSSAAARLGWTLKRFEKKIDNVCDKLTNFGVRGLKGEAGNLASSRRARLVGPAVSARLVTAADLELLRDVPPMA